MLHKAVLIAQIWIAISIFTIRVYAVQTVVDVPASEILDKITQGQAVVYDRVRVIGSLELRSDQAQGVQVNVPVKITNAEFTAPVNFIDITFSRGVDFSGTTFGSDAAFVGVIFNFDAVFTGAIFRSGVSFYDAHFDRVASFDKIICTGTYSFLDANVEGDGFFSGAVFKGAAEFSDSTFDSEVIFDDATFHAKAYFEDSTLGKFGSFRGATFYKEADFQEAETAKFDFSSTTFQPGGLVLYGTEYGALLTDSFNFDVLANTAQDITHTLNVLFRLGEIFNNQQQVWFANEAAYRSWQFRQITSSNPVERMVLLLADYSMGYGYRLGNLLLTTVLFVITFALVFCSFNLVRRVDTQTNNPGGENVIFGRFTGIQVISDGSAKGPVNWRERVLWACVYSVMVTSRIRLSTRAYAVRNGWVAGLQWWLGLLLLGALTFSLIANFPIIKQLVEQFFS